MVYFSKVFKDDTCTLTVVYIMDMYDKIRHFLQSAFLKERQNFSGCGDCGVNLEIPLVLLFFFSLSFQKTSERRRREPWLQT